MEHTRTFCNSLSHFPSQRERQMKKERGRERERERERERVTGAFAPFSYLVEYNYDHLVFKITDTIRG